MLKLTNKITFTFILTILPLLIWSQEQKQPKKIILDSIIKEANLLYNYEKVVWNATDLAFKNKNLKTQMGAYVVHHSMDTLFVVFADKTFKKQLIKYTFLNNNLRVPITSDLEVKPLTKKATKLCEAKTKILKNINSNAESYGFNFQEGFNPNLVMIPALDGYRFYIIIGTTKQDVIPFGNDYLFKTDHKGTILSWQKFHKTLIATQAKGPKDKVILSTIHSHLKMTPYISATDICTFRLYGYDLFGMEEFMVSSTAFDKVFKYNARLNEITMVDF
jgi:hypothetical protein